MQVVIFKRLAAAPHIRCPLSLQREHTTKTVMLRYSALWDLRCLLGQDVIKN